MKLTALVCAVLLPVVCSATTPTIGTVTSSGNVESTLAEGSVLRTDRAASDVLLESGVAVHLAAASAGTIFSDHAVLERGAARVSNFAGYPVHAGELDIESETPNSQAVIRFQKDTIKIASLGGPLKVYDGALLTRVAAGSRMSFQNSGAAPGQTGAASAKKPRSETKTWVWVIVGISAAALAIGLTAAAQGKSPF